MNSNHLLPLDAWAQATYGDHAPSIHTLRRWARDGHIFPAPEKHGRSYFVAPEARYASTGASPQRRLVRIVHESAAQKRA